MQYQMRLFIADNKQNNLMSRLDLRPEYKWFISAQEVSFKTEKNVDEEYLLKIINESKNNDDFWIPAIDFCGKIYSDPKVKELSDGQNVFFIPQ